MKKQKKEEKESEKAKIKGSAGKAAVLYKGILPCARLRPAKTLARIAKPVFALVFTKKSSHLNPDVKKFFLVIIQFLLFFFFLFRTNEGSIQKIDGLGIKIHHGHGYFSIGLKNLHTWILNISAVLKKSDK